MDLRRLRVGEWIAAVSGAVLILSLFLPWYEVPGPVSSDPAGIARVTAWEAYSLVDVLLLVLAVLAVGLLILTAFQPTAAVGVAADALLTIVAGLLAIVAAVRVLDTPGALEAPAGVPDETSRTAFALIGLVAVFGVCAGAIVALRDERLSAPGEHTDATGVPVSQPPEIETLPAPLREG